VRAATRRCTLTAPGALFILLTPVLAAAQPAIDGPGEPARTLKTGKVVHAVRIVSAPPVIDGHVTDEAWVSAPSATDFVQRDPDNGEAMTEGTRVHVAYDDRYLYVAVVSLDSAPGAIATGLGRRDQLPSSDFVSIGFDPRHDHQRAYVFRTNPSSVQMDFALTDDDRMDSDYDAVWDVRAEMVSGGWAAEFRVPFSQMRFTASPQAGQVWGFQAQRFILRKGEEGAWVGKPRGERGEVSLYGHLVFDESLSAPGRLEIVPYMLTRSERLTGTAADGSPFAASAGADMRVGLGSAATLSATVNPDFGQVEQDPAVLNLSVFETFFPEKRPFFLEDSRVFVPPYGLFQLFHSRRIGRAPAHIALPDGDDEIDRPDDTTIYGAAKVTGKSGRWTYGGLTAATGREFAVVEAALQRTERLVEPATSYNVFRLQRDVLGGSSNVGAIGTGVLRPGADDAFTGGFDYNLRWDQNRKYWNGHWVLTRAPGDGGLKNGGGGVMNFGIGRKHWNMWSHYDHFSRDFRVSDLGFFRTRANRHSLDGGLNLEQPDPGSRLRNYGVNMCAVNGWNDDRLLIDRAVCANSWVTFLNFWRAQAGLTRRLEVWDDVDTRGGPPILDPPGTFYYAFLNSDSRKSWRLNLGTNGQVGSAGDRDRAWSASLSLQPSTRLQLSLSTRHERGTAIAQWIENSDTDGDGDDDHVYGTLDRNVVDITLRGTYSLHRDLTFQAYLQPFVAAGDYQHIRRLARPRSFEFEPVTIDDDPEFNTKSVRGNMVLRWEYVRGSALFVVWELSQTDESRPGTFSAFRDLRDAFGAGANHVVMVKATYWLNR
jgi:hypothetical protein